MEKTEKETKSKKRNFKISRYKVKIISLNVVNVLLIFGTIYFLHQLPTKAKEVKRSRSENLASQSSSDVAVLKAELDKNLGSIDTVNTAFVNYEGFISFLSQMETLQEQTVIQDLKFPVTRTVLDKDKNPGLPFSMVFEGSVSDINTAYERFIHLPYLIKTVEATLIKQEGSYRLEYAGFIYANEEFNKN